MQISAFIQCCIPLLVISEHYPAKKDASCSSINLINYGVKEGIMKYLRENDKKKLTFVENCMTNSFYLQIRFCFLTKSEETTCVSLGSQYNYLISTFITINDDAHWCHIVTCHLSFHVIPILLFRKLEALQKNLIFSQIQIFFGTHLLSVPYLFV